MLATKFLNGGQSPPNRHVKLCPHLAEIRLIEGIGTMSMAFDAVYKLKRELDASPPPLKSWIDRACLKYIVKNILPWGGRATEQKEIVRGKSFIEAILPFCDIYYESNKSQVKYVPADQVMAGHYCGHEDMCLNDLPDFLDILDSKAEDDGHPEQARYNQIGDFPIYRAYEGKNRIDLYRKIGRPIKAAVCRTIYPKPETLKLLKIKLFPDCYALEYQLDADYSIRPTLRNGIISLKGNKVIKILAFNESIQILEEYGVKWGGPIFSLLAPIQKSFISTLVAHSFYRR